MIGHKFLLALFISFLPCLVFPQPGTQVKNYSKADGLAMTVKYDGDIYRLTKQLTNPFSNQELKARAIFRWVTDNIAYDCRYFNKTAYKGKEPETFECNSDDSLDCVIRKNVWEMRYINHLLDSRKAVCQGYAMLFKKMCNIAGMESEVIPGYIRTEEYQIGSPGELDHAWNAVRINGNYYLVDATWAAGSCSKKDNGKLKEFHKHFDDYYWLTPADEFARDHYPEEPKWVLIANFTKDKFSANPYYAPEVMHSIKLLTPYTGIIAAKRGDTIRFRLRYAGHFKDLQINTNVFQNPDIYYLDYITKRKAVKRLDSLALKQQQYIKYKQNGDTYEFAYVVKDNSLDYLDILFDTKQVMRFKVRVR